MKRRSASPIFQPLLKFLTKVGHLDSLVSQKSRQSEEEKSCKSVAEYSNIRNHRLTTRSLSHRLPKELPVEPSFEYSNIRKHMRGQMHLGNDYGATSRNRSRLHARLNAPPKASPPIPSSFKQEDHRPLDGKVIDHRALSTRLWLKFPPKLLQLNRSTTSSKCLQSSSLDIRQAQPSPGTSLTSTIAQARNLGRDSGTTGNPNPSPRKRLANIRAYRNLGLH